MSRSYAIFCFAVGYSVVFLAFGALGFAILMPFGYGYIGAELGLAYMAWATILRWDYVQLQLASMLAARGL